VPSDEGPHRKYYGINDSGRAALDEQTATWTHFADTDAGAAQAPAAAQTPRRRR
jgi:PadR family transcriptional regulator PadR